MDPSFGVVGVVLGLPFCGAGDVFGEGGVGVDFVVEGRLLAWVWLGNGLLKL